MYRALVIFIFILSFKEYKLCNAAILPPEMPLAAFEESDAETLISVKSVDTPISRHTPPPSVTLKGSVTLSSLIKDTMMQNFLSKHEVIRRASKYAELIGCPASVLIAQDALESRFGKSKLTQRTKNSGNVKCRCNGSLRLRRIHDKLNKTTPVCVRGFDKIEGSNDYYEVMPSAWHGWRRKARLIANYRVVKKQKGKELTAKEWCRIFHLSPYATDKRYDKKLWSTICKYDLEKIDEAINKGLKITSHSGKYIFYD